MVDVLLHLRDKAHQGSPIVRPGVVHEGFEVMVGLAVETSGHGTSTLLALAQLLRLRLEPPPKLHQLPLVHVHLPPLCEEEDRLLPVQI